MTDDQEVGVGVVGLEQREGVDAVEPVRERISMIGSMFRCAQASSAVSRARTFGLV